MSGYHTTGLDMAETKKTYTVCLDSCSIETIERMARARDLPARVFLRQLILRSLRDEIRNEEIGEAERRSGTWSSCYGSTRMVS